MIPIRLGLNILNSIIAHKYNKIPNPGFVTFFNTDRCNLKCVFCDVWKVQSPKKSELTTEQTKTIFRKLPKFDVFRISGGEPFLRSDISDIVNFVDENNKPFMIHLTTNGVLKQNIIRNFENFKNPKKIQLAISIDGTNNRHDYIRGLDGTYEKVMDTIESLIPLRKVMKFKIGVNHAVVNEADIPDYSLLKKILEKYEIPIYAKIANTSEKSLYNKDKGSPEKSVVPFGEWSDKGIESFMNETIFNLKSMNNFKKKLVVKYYLKGLKYRMVNKKNIPKPKCVALTSHLRILANGDVPTCLYNGEIVGNLLKDNFHDIWYKSSKVKKQRNWVSKCVNDGGCWEGCESIVSGIYTGDILRRI